MQTSLLYYLAFLIGQALFLLKRVGLAIRSPMNTLKSPAQYIKLNWMILSVRMAFEFALLFWPYRNQDLINQWLAPHGWKLPFQIPQAAIIAGLLGFFSDSMLDWIGGHDKVFGIPVPSWLKEEIPQIPAVQQLLTDAAETKKGDIANGK